ncbi:precorrin-6y C5,15-methyltransferase (decarboxylating) subunit CbiE [Janibacter sp. GXQ6167]|uniref:precorrin-6y C5,15-methyltransferase (decarboxylating) subunit CbiE n=1 Tax=Janibacter sp. GXQ6167 TaxID=3240791 RepID=UPI0035254BC6
MTRAIKVAGVIEVVGIGEAGWEALGPHERSLVERARLVMGGARHLEFLPEIEGQERRAWPSPLRPALPGLAREPGPVVVLASGDPLRSGIGTTLIEVLGADSVSIYPTVSSDLLARARMGWSAESVQVITLVGRDIDRVVRWLTPGARLIVLCGDGDGPARVADRVSAAGYGDSAMTAWWHLGGPREGSSTATAATWGPEPTPDLVLVCLEVADGGADQGPAPGRSEDAFDHDGQITKRDVRASALAHLRPTPGQVLWDLGAGSGAVGIEWALAAPGALTVAVERDLERAARVEANAARLGVPEAVTVVTGETIEVLGALPSPDAVFFGGGVDRDVLAAAWSRLPIGGRCVVHAVTLEAEEVCLAAFREHGGSLTRLSVEHAEALGRYLSWKPARPITQWSATKIDPLT